MPKVISQRKLDELRREWQKTLRLQDWKITSKFVTPGEMPKGYQDSVGYNEIKLHAKQSNIKILDPELANAERRERAADVEDTLVHELIHCHVQPFWTPDEPMNTLIEQMIEVVAGALVGLKRKKNG